MLWRYTNDERNVLVCGQQSQDGLCFLHVDSHTLLTGLDVGLSANTIDQELSLKKRIHVVKTMCSDAHADQLATRRAQ